MKNTLLLVFLGLSLACPVWAAAADATNAPPLPPPPSAPPPMRPGNLTPDEMLELNKAHDAAFQADPALIAEVKDVMEKTQALQMKIKAAMIKADPKVGPIFAKLESGPRMGPGGPPPPAPPSAPPPAPPSGPTPADK